MSLTKEQQVMVESHLRLAVRFAFKYSVMLKLRRDDLESEAMYALCRAARTYDPNKGYKFTTYAVTAMINSFYALLKKTRSTATSSLSSIDMSYDDDQRQLEIKEIIARLRKNLSESDFIILKMVYGEDRSLASCSKELGINPSTLRRRVQELRQGVYRQLLELDVI